MRIKRILIYLPMLLLASLPLIIMMGHRIMWPPIVWENIPLHAAMEGLGAMCGIVMSVVLYQRSQEPGMGRLFFLAAGLMGMGVIDAFHAASTLKSGYILLRSISSLIGGLWFSLAILPGAQNHQPQKPWIFGFVTLGTILFGLSVFTFHEGLPLMTSKVQFTLPALIINYSAGVLFIISALFFAREYHLTKRMGNYLMACLALLFGSAGLTFVYSELWGDEWWLYHVMRLLAYLLALGYVINGFIRIITKLRITLAEQRIMERELRKSEERYRTIFEAANNVSLIVTDLAGEETKIMEFSPGAERIFGYRREEIIGQSVARLHLPEDVDKFPEEMALLRQNRGGVTGETTMVRKSGEDFPALFNTFPLSDGDGNITATLGVTIDITDLKKVEEELRESEAFSSGLLNNSPIPIIVFNPDTSIKFVNPALENLTGFSASDLLNRKAPYPWWTENEEQYEILQEIMRHGARRREMIFRNRAGKRIWVEVTSNAVTRGEKVNYYMSNWVDITKRREAELALRESEEKFRTLVVNATDGIVIMADGGGLVFANDRAAFLTGYTVQNLLQMTMKDLIHPDEFLVLTDTNPIMAEGEYIPRHYETTLLHKERRKLPVEVAASRTIWRGRPVNLIFFRDISERKRLEERLMKALSKTDTGLHRTDTGLHKLLPPKWRKEKPGSKE